VTAAERAALGRLWLADALSEHASIASFARATLELMAVGAPPELLRGCQRAALEEVRHAELCFRLARRFSGRALDPGVLPAPAARSGGLPAVARDTFLEGCVAETVAAHQSTHALDAVRDGEVRAVLARIVRDEMRHAELAWRTVAWAVREGGASVLAVVRWVATRARAALRWRWTPGPGWPRGLSRASMAAYGRLEPAVEAACERAAWRELIEPALALLGGSHEAA